MRNPKPAIPKDRNSIFSTFEATRDRNEIGVCITSTNNPEKKHVNCPDTLSCPGRRMVINPDNENQYLCLHCGDTLDIDQHTRKE